MHRDIVIPKSNESKFIKIAEALGYDQLVLIYPLEKYKEKKYDTKLNIKFGIICKSNQITKAKQKSKLVFVSDFDNVQKELEKQKSIIVSRFETSSRCDFLHQRNAGLNQVVCKLMNKNKIKRNI